MKDLLGKQYFSKVHLKALAVTNGGTFAANSEFEDGTLAVPTRKNYVFDGWYSDSNFDNIVDNNKVDTCTVYYAKWEECDHTEITYEYIRKDNVLTQRCAGCKQVFGTATINAPTELTYDGKAKEATVTTTDGWEGDVPEIKYYSGETALDSAPVEAGTYTASITAGGKTASVEFTITRDEPETPDRPSIPSFIPGIIAGGASQMQRFVDVTSMDYYFDAVQWAVEHGITTGTGKVTFSPDAPCTRAQAVTFLYRAIGVKSATEAGFSDVPANAYYADAVNWAAQYGITGGTGANKFSPNATCTRSQIVTFLYRAN